MREKMFFSPSLQQPLLEVHSTEDALAIMSAKG